MSDDIFKLGNFEDVDEIGSPSASSEASADKPPSPINGQATTNEREVMAHPTEKASVQAKFRSHDGQPLLEIALDQIVPNEFQPRRIFNEEKLQELANSIKEHGIIQPIVVTLRDDGKYEIVVGERRFRASKLAGLASVPVFVSENLDAETKLELALIENVQRADLNPIEEAKAYERLHSEFGLKYVDVARKVGKDFSTVSNLIRLLRLPVEIQRALIEGVIAEGQARPLLTLKEHEEMIQMFHIIVANNMRVRDIESKVREIKQRQIKVKEMFTPDPFLESLENILRNKLGTRVQVNKGAKGGKITIEFYSDEELNSIIGKLTPS
ncbi:MAG: ParB/RepB/Spo0J family partition protein [bacterium]|nr:ParB/RepB/Spo0J family partition protein [bacterium]